MPNGRPGDHPLTDILRHGGSDYGEPVDGLVRELAAHPRFPEIRDAVASLLMQGWQDWVSGDAEARSGLIARFRALTTQFD